MKMNIKKKYIIFLAGLLFFMFYLFWGPLFPWSPIKIGYKKINTPIATIYISNITEGDSAIYKISDIIREDEKFHDLHFLKKIKIVFLNKDSHNKRYIPWLKGSGYSVSLSPLNLIYIGQNARKSPSEIESYLKHELSHMLIDQNTTFKKAMKIHQQAWLVEGIAEYFSGHIYYSKNKLNQFINIDNAHPPNLIEKSPQEMSWQELQLNYSYYKYFIEFLIEKYSLKKMQKYLKHYAKNPAAYREIFTDVYSVELNNVLNDFNSSFLE